jgi:hypothetical protein
MAPSLVVLLAALSKETMFYTYAHYKPDNSVFYIGKGQRNRAWAKDNRNSHWRNVVAKHGEHKVEVLAQWPTEQEAFEHEKFLIWCFRDMGFSMANVTAGGDGISGYKHTEETKAKLSLHQKHFHNLPEQKAKNSALNKIKMQNPAHRERVRAGAVAYMVKPENRERSRQAALQQTGKPEFKIRQRALALARMQKPEYRLLMAKPCMCIETGQIFQSQADAAKWIGPNARPQTINRAISKQRKTAYGFQWKMINKE